MQKEKSDDPKIDLSRYKDIWVYIEIQDHEKVLEGSLELLTKARELKKKLEEKVVAVVLGLDVEQYLEEIEKYGPDIIYYGSSPDFKHYNGELFPDIIEKLIREKKPSIFLSAATESGVDLCARLAKRFETGLTAHCSELEIWESKDYPTPLLLMKRPAFSGNVLASIICPYRRPQMATVQRGVFEKIEIPERERIKCKKIKIEYHPETTQLKIINIDKPTRYNRRELPLEKARVVIVGGRGLQSKKNFDKLFELASLLNAEVGATRIPVFNRWCEEERMVGQTGKIIKPDLYISFGVSGQIQHTSAIMESKRIISINHDPEAPIFNISDYYIVDDAPEFLSRLITRIKKEKTQK